MTSFVPVEFSTFLTTASHPALPVFFIRAFIPFAATFAVIVTFPRSSDFLIFFFNSSFTFGSLNSLGGVDSIAFIHASLNVMYSCCYFSSCFCEFVAAITCPPETEPTSNKITDDNNVAKIFVLLFTHTPISPKAFPIDTLSHLFKIVKLP